MLTDTVLTVYDEFLEYLAQRAAPEEILAFKASESAQRRADELTERNKAGELSPEEALELEQMLRFNRLVALLKVKALNALQTR
ncbi:MAG: hypothetical protein K8I60_11985 [Anaerolineae bacterium]|nr:hypothetical protein [Anaerolineae bacterium]